MKRLTICALICCSFSVAAAELYRWVDPESGSTMMTPTPPPYPIKETQPGGTLPNGQVLKVIFDENSPQYKAAIAKKKAAEAEQKRVAQEQAKAQAAKEAEHQRLVEAKEAEAKIAAERRAALNAENARLEARNAAIRAERQKIQDEERTQRLASATARAPDTTEINDCLKVLKATYAFKDQESLRVEGVPAALLFKDGEKQVALSVNAKNGFGAYAGPKDYVCSFFPNGKSEAVAKSR